MASEAWDEFGRISLEGASDDKRAVFAEERSVWVRFAFYAVHYTIAVSRLLKLPRQQE
jgi:hypothetical protein